MDKSSVKHIPLEEQQKAWTQWHATTTMGNARAQREWVEVEAFLRSLHRPDLRILEIGCGTGWLSERLVEFGSVTALDLSEETIRNNRDRVPTVTFLSGDFFEMPLPVGAFDVVVSQHVLSHVEDQPLFIARMADLMADDGYGVIATQNRPVLERWDRIPGPQPGQLRHWLSASELRRVLKPHFPMIRIGSVLPSGEDGYLRVVNSVRLNAALSYLVPKDRIERAKEDLLLGQTLIAVVSKGAPLPPKTT